MNPQLLPCLMLALILLNKEAVKKVISEIKPDVIVHCAAWMAVDMAEDDENFCVEFYKQYGLATKITPVTAEEYDLSKAVRLSNSRLDRSKLSENGFEPLPTWKDAVKRYLEEAKL